jgi:hypothetical protein
MSPIGLARPISIAGTCGGLIAIGAGGGEVNLLSRNDCLVELSDRSISESRENREAGWGGVSARLAGMLMARLGGVTGGGGGVGSAGLVGRSRAADLTGRSGPETILVSEKRVGVGSFGLR